LLHHAFDDSGAARARTGRPSHFLSVLSILLAVALVLPAAAFAADILPPRQETAGQILPGSCSGNCCPPEYRYCVDANTLRSERHWLISDGVNYTQYDQISETTCTDGCSMAMNDCRASSFGQILLFLAIVTIFGVIILISSHFEVMGFWVMLLVFVSSVGIAVMDIFGPAFDILTKMLPFVILLFGIYHYARYYFQNKDKEDEVEPA